MLLLFTLPACWYSLPLQMNGRSPGWIPVKCMSECPRSHVCLFFFYINLCAGMAHGVGRVFLRLTCSWAPAGHITKQREGCIWHSYGWFAQCLSASKSAWADQSLTKKKIRLRLPLYIVTPILQNVSQDLCWDGLSWSGPRFDFTLGQCVEFMSRVRRRAGENVKTQREI